MNSSSWNSCHPKSWFINSGEEEIWRKNKTKNKLTNRGYKYLLKSTLKTLEKDVKSTQVDTRTLEQH